VPLRQAAEDVLRQLYFRKQKRLRSVFIVAVPGQVEPVATGGEDVPERYTMSKWIAGDRITDIAEGDGPELCSCLCRDY